MTVLISRYGAKFGDGDRILWTIGEKAIVHGTTGEHPVTISSGFVKSSETDDVCIEVTFDNENDAKYCVSAKTLVPLGGFPPLPEDF